MAWPSGENIGAPSTEGVATNAAGSSPLPGRTVKISCAGRTATNASSPPGDQENGKARRANLPPTIVSGAPLPSERFQSIVTVLERSELYASLVLSAVHSGNSQLPSVVNRSQLFRPSS